MTSFRPLSFVSALLVVSACQSAAVAPQPPCKYADVPCAQLDKFAVLSTNLTESELLLRAAKSAAQDFQRLFGAMPPATIIVPSGTVSTDVQSRLTANGYEVTLPWISPADRASMRQQMIRRQVEEQMANQPKALQDAAMAAALAATQTATQTQDETIDLAAMSHELGHMWFINQYQGTGQKQTGHAYGGWAPDWMDEAAAVALETEALKVRRRAKFTQMDDQRRIPLVEFLSMDHPSAKAAQDMSERMRATQSGSKTSSRAILLSGQEAKDFIAASGGDRAADFYAQTLVFTDYLENRSATVDILSRIAASLAQGLQFEAWLAKNDVGLPTNLTALDADWSAYTAALSVDD